MAKIERGIEVWEKVTGFHVGNFAVSIKHSDIKQLFDYKKDDPLYYCTYEITPELATRLNQFTDFEFNFDRYEYFFAAWAYTDPIKRTDEERIERIKVNAWRQDVYKCPQRRKEDKTMKLKLNYSLGIFKLKSSIDNYLSYSHEIVPPSVYTNYIQYKFINFEGIEVWAKDGLINTIRSENTCFLNGENLIGMKLDAFIEKYKPEILYSYQEPFPMSNNCRFRQSIYDFKKMGLMLWVWRNRIRIVLIFDSSSYT